MYLTPHKWLLVVTSLLILSIATLVIGITQGSVNIPITDVWGILTHSNTNILQQQIILELRLPRILNAFLVGALLSFSGLLMQVLLKNPLAEPYILGISGGASVASLSLILLGISSIWIPAAAFGGAIIATLLVFIISGGNQQKSPEFLLLTGVVIAAGWGAIINLLLSISNAQELQTMVFWMLGDLSNKGFHSWMFLSFSLLLILTLPLARKLNALMHGEESALSLGININSLKLRLYFLSAASTALAVSIAGSIGFVGLIIPHMLRLLIGSDHRLLLVATPLLGGSFLCLADTLARTLLSPQSLPVGVVTAIIGVPMFILLLHRQHKAYQ